MDVTPTELLTGELGMLRSVPQPRVSVLMAAYNAAPFIGSAIDSVLGQTYRDFELLVLDDASTDDTAALVSAYDDPRIRLIPAPRNLGVVGVRNLGLASARGAYLAIHDADDISHPTRLARQVAHLDSHPADVLVSTDLRQLLPDGRMVPSRYHGPAGPLLLEWMLHLGNPIAFSSTMMRVSALRRLPEFLREERRYAEDFDLHARLRALGGISRIAMPLLIYRVYPESTSSRHRVGMVEQTGRVLDQIWPPALFAGHERLALAALVGRHIACMEPVEAPETLEQLRDTLDLLLEHFLAARPGLSGAERDSVALYASRVWEQTVRVALRTGRLGLPRAGLRRATGGGAGWAGAMLRAMPRRMLARLTTPSRPRAGTPEPILQAGPVAQPPELFVTVVLEGPACGATPAAGAPPYLLHGRDVFDTYGLRPAYLLDEAALADAATTASVRQLAEAGACAAGLWWSPELPADAARAFLARADAALGAPATFAPEEALRALAGTPDGAPPDVRALPVSTGVVGNSGSVMDWVSLSGLGAFDSASVPGQGRDVSRRIGLLPNELASEPQIMLIRALMTAGQRRFFLRLHLRHSGQGNQQALERMSRVVRFFCEDQGGLPGSVIRLSALRARQPAPEAVG